jgi:pimeloyl-ACP methyl ester carboxylesterase
MNALKSSVEEVHGTALNVVRHGDGPPLLFLHGAGGLKEAEPLLQELAQHFTCIAPEHPGFGGSVRPDWLDRVSDLANFYLDFIDQSGLVRPHVVGHDLGGWIGADMAVRSGLSFATLSLISSQGIYVPDVETVDVFLRSDEQLLRDTYFDAAIVDRLLAQERASEELDIAIQDKEMTARLTWQPRGHDPFLQKWLHRIKAPTLVIWGEDDKVLPVAYGRAWEASVKDAQLVVIPRCGHAPHVEQTGATIGALTRFTNAFGSAA